jgi:molecular chaperone HscB
LFRAQYLLSLRGIEVAEDETAKVEDPELLMEVLEAREAIEEAEKEEDLEGLREQNDRRMRESEEIIEEAFRQDDLARAKGEAVKLRYWVNIRESIEGWERGVPVVLQH